MVIFFSFMDCAYSFHASTRAVSGRGSDFSGSPASCFSLASFTAGFSVIILVKVAKFGLGATLAGASCLGSAAFAGGGEVGCLYAGGAVDAGTDDCCFTGAMVWLSGAI